MVISSCLSFGQSEIAWQEHCLTNNPFDNRFASYSPDGNWIVFESNRDGNWEIYIMDSHGKNIKRLTQNSVEDRRPSWHPNGRKILFESNRNGVNNLYTITLDKGKERQLSKMTEVGELIFAMYAPSGKKIAVSEKESENKSNIILLSKKGKKIKTLVENGKRNYFPKWSNDGKELIYFSRKDTNNQDDEIYRMNLKTGTEMRLTNWQKHNFCPAWSFDDSQIAYVTSMENTRPEIYIMDKDGSNQSRITYNEDGETLPNWHPRAPKLLVTAYRNGSFQICELKKS